MNPNKLRNILGQPIGRFNVSKMLILPKLIYTFNTIQMKILKSIKKIKILFRCMWKCKRPRMVK